MLMTAFLTVAMTPVNFAGGTANELAEAIHKATNAPVVLSAASSAKMPAFVFDPGDANQLAQAMRKNALLTQNPGLQLTFHPGVLPPELVQLRPIYRAKQVWWGAPEVDANEPADGKVTLETKRNEAWTLDRLAEFKWSKELVYFPHQTAFPMSVRVKDMAERDFLTYVARVVGARLVITRDSYTFSIDPADMRLRSQRSLQSMTPQQRQAANPSDRAAIDLAMIAVNNATNQNFVELFEGAEGTTRVLLSGSSATQALNIVANWSREEAAAAEAASVRAANPRGGGPGRTGREQRGPGRTVTAVPFMLSNVDTRQQVAIVLQRSFRTSLEFFVFRQANQPSQITRLNFPLSQMRGGVEVLGSVPMAPQPARSGGG